MTNIAIRPVVRGGLRLAVVLTLALGASACSTMQSLDPTGLLGGDDQTTASSTTTPDLAGVPDKPVTSTPDDQQAVSDSLAADGAKNQYSADALRAGTEAAAAPPPPASAATPAEVAEAAPPPAPAAAEPAASPPPAAESPAPPPPADTAPAPAAAAAEAAAMPPAAPGAEPAVPANSGPHMGGAIAMNAPTDAQLGFKPSTAAPLDASISQWVPAPIVARYRQTAENAGIPDGVNAPAVAVAVPAHRRHKGREIAMGGPEAMSGSVVANMDAVQGAPSIASDGVTPAAVIYFPGDGTTLSAAARAEIHAAVAAYNANGGTGTIRIVGHASSRTANMPVEKHLMVIFEKSQNRANAVAKEVILEGIPASKVLVEAVGDSQPVYYESMPKGEDGNRRAEIFLQG